MKAKIDSLASLKRAVSNPNVVIRVISHWQSRLVGTERKPCKVQGNGYFFYGPQASAGKIVRMWAPYAKSSELRFNEDGTVTFYPDTEKSWTLLFEID